MKNEISTAKELILLLFKSNRLFISLGVLFIVGVDLLQLIPPLILNEALDIITENPASNDMLFWAAAYFLVCILMALCRSGWRVFVFLGSTLTERKLRSLIINKMFSISSAERAKLTSGEQMALISNDTESVKRLFDGGFIVLVDAVIFIVFSPIIMWYLCPELTIFTLIPFPLIPLLNRLSEKKIKKRFSGVQKSFSDLMTKAQDALGGIRIIRSLGAEKKFSNNFETEGKNYIRNSMNLVRVESLLMPSLQLVTVVSMVILVLYGGSLVIKGTITIGTFIAFQKYLEGLRWPAEATGISVSIYQRGMASAERICKFLRIPDDVSENNSSIEVNNSQISIEVKDLSYSYEGTESKALDSLSFKIHEGERVALIGDIGSGKSTFANILTRKLTIPDGKIFFNDTDINQVDSKTLNSIVCIIPQEPFLYNTSIKHNLEIALLKSSNTQETLTTATKKANIFDEINSFDEKFNTIIGERGIKLSGGQRQRLTIARGLIKPETALTIYDDTLSSVDTQTEHKILNALDDLRGETTEIFITHRLSTIKKVDRIFIFKDGQVLNHGTHDELLVKSKWYQLFYSIQNASV